MKPLSPATREVFELFEPNDWRWNGEARVGHWFETHWIATNAGHRRGYRQLRALALSVLGDQVMAWHAAASCEGNAP